MNENNTPIWAKELLEEIREIRDFIQEKERIEQKKNAYYEYVQTFRKIMRPDPSLCHFPVIKFKGRVLALTNEALLYDKRSGRTLNTFDAQSIYRELYEQHLYRITTK